jgi:homoserine kinase type II
MLLSEVNDGGFRSACTAWLGDRDALVEWLARDAFSGSSIVRLCGGDPEGDLVLKSFPATARPRIAWVHGLMTSLRAAGCLEVPAVVAGRSGGTVIEDGHGRAWEAVRFVPGIATDEPSVGQAKAAAAAVARLHRAAAAWPSAPPRVAVPPAVTRRIEQAGRMLSEPWHSVAAPGGPGTSLGDALAARVVQAAAIARETGLAGVLQRVMAEGAAPGMLQAVVRDLWSSHVLFATVEPTRVAGIVDFHAAAVDTPATDLARLLGSWCRGAAIPMDDACREALAAYESIRPLSAEEHRLVPWLDATATIFGLDNWFRWVLVEGRRFEGSARVLERVDRLVGRLPEAVAWLGGRRCPV